jgi:hypothetical protein
MSEDSYVVKPNRLEQKLYDELKRVLPNADIRQQYRDRATGYVYDLFLPEYNIVIEIQSWAFHGLPIYNAGVDGQEKMGKLLWDEEMKRQRAIAAAGYFYFPFSGRDIHFEAWQCAKLLSRAVAKLDIMNTESALSAV